MKPPYGEFTLIEAIRARFADIATGANTGIGDDCAILPVDATHSLVVTTDMLVEDIHFLRAATSAADLGYKSLAVNLSDIAAMGAEPTGSFLSVALPGDLSAEWVDDFMEGYHSLSVRYGVPLLGGDTTASKGAITVSVTAVGRTESCNIKKRNAAQPGDIIFVTGELGGSARGLLDIGAGLVDSPFIPLHHRPEPAIAQGIWLGSREEVHAMMDISDGIASDLRHILTASGAGAEVFIETIPTRVGVELAVTGGEDYHLLCTVSAETASALQSDYEAYFGAPLYPIGRIVQGVPRIAWSENGIEIHPDWKGFTHF